MKKKKIEKVSSELEIQNSNGMHARPSASFAKLASNYKSDILVEKDGEQVNGKSILGLMMLAAGVGSKIKVSAEGPDAKDALDDLKHLVDNKFED